MKNKLHILVSVSKIYDNVNDYVAVAIVTSYSARMLYLGPTRDMYSEIWSARLYPLVKILVYKVLVQMDRLIKFIYQYCRFWGWQTWMILYIREGCFPDITRSNDWKTWISLMITLLPTEGENGVGRIESWSCKSKKQIRWKDSLSDVTKEWLEEMWLEKMTPLTGHISYDEFAIDIADLNAVE